MKASARSIQQLLMTTVPLTSLALAAVVAGTASVTVHADEWRVLVGSETPHRGSQALAFLPNEIWIHAGDSIRWIFPPRPAISSSSASFMRT